jgi:hypothetical protein
MLRFATAIKSFGLQLLAWTNHLLNHVLDQKAGGVLDGVFQMVEGTERWMALLFEEQFYEQLLEIQTIPSSRNYSDIDVISKHHLVQSCWWEATTHAHNQGILEPDINNRINYWGSGKEQVVSRPIGGLLGKGIVDLDLSEVFKGMYLQPVLLWLVLMARVSSVII